jgi:hypothetical protein
MVPEECSDRYRQGWGCTGGSTMTQHMRSRRVVTRTVLLSGNLNAVFRGVLRVLFSASLGLELSPPCGGLSEQCAS